MKDIRAGEHLWSEWDGIGLDVDEALVYYTYGHISTEHDIVKHALASALQRDGVVASLSQGFRTVENAEMLLHAWVGTLEDERDEIVCDHRGETEYGDFVVDPVPVTYIVINLTI